MPTRPASPRPWPRCWRATGGTLDALFNNGAFACPGAVEDLPRGALREIFEVNLFGYHDLTRRVIPVMRAQGHGRIVNCSSVLGLVGVHLARGLCGDQVRDGRPDRRAADRDAGHRDRRDPDRARARSPRKIRENAIPHFERWIDWENSARREQYAAACAGGFTTRRPRRTRFELAARGRHRQADPRAGSTAVRSARYYVTTPTYLMGFARGVCCRPGRWTG